MGCYSALSCCCVLSKSRGFLIDPPNSDVPSRYKLNSHRHQGRAGMLILHI